MTNRQSNIIFYGVIATVICGLIVSNLYPDFFGDMSKSEEQLAIKEAVVQGQHNKAISIYQTLVDQRISDSNEFTIGTANMYEAMANLHALAGNKAEEKAHYLKSLDIKKQLKKLARIALHSPTSNSEPSLKQSSNTIRHNIIMSSHYRPSWLI